MVNSHNCEFHTSRILTFGRLLTLALGLFLLCVNAMADVVINRYNGSDTPNYTGSDLYTVQTAEGAANGDVITVSDDITPPQTDHYYEYGYIVNLDEYPVTNFTLQAASSSKPVTITGASVKKDDANLDFNSLYYLRNGSISTINLKDVTIKGFTYPIYNHGSPSITINADNVTFENNPQENDIENMAIYHDSVNSDLKLKIHGYNENSEITFKNYTDGAMTSLDDCDFSTGKFFFTGNTTRFAGGAINSYGVCDFSNGEFHFTGNTADMYGGAICVYDYYNIGVYGYHRVHDISLIFSGNNTVATFTGNAASTRGNDIIFMKSYSESGIYLTFKDKGTYYFDGGIEVTYYDYDTNLQTSIDKAQVTIAGRQYKPVNNEGDTENVEDNTNVYTLGKVSVSNGGNLSAQMDYINYLHGNFTICDAQSAIVLSDSTKDQTATIKSSTGEGGSFEMEFEAEGSVRTESVFISSGRVDIKGAMEAELEVEANATFSPGNSVGDMLLTGSFTLDPNATLLIEMDETGVDTLTASTFDLDGQIDFRVTSAIPSGTVYDILVATDENFTFGSDILDQVLNGKTLPSYMDLSVENNGKVVRLTIDHDNIPVPEPSTWALMALGVAGLMYWRKRRLAVVQ